MKLKTLFIITSLLFTNNWLLPVKIRNICTIDHENICKQIRLLRDKAQQMQNLKKMTAEDQAALLIREYETMLKEYQKAQQLRELETMLAEDLKAQQRLKYEIMEKKLKARLIRTNNFVRQITQNYKPDMAEDAKINSKFNEIHYSLS